MFELKIGLMTVALLVATATFPVAAQPSPPENDATRGDTLSAAIPDETVVKASAALRDVLVISSAYSPKIEAAPTPTERVRLTSQAMDAATKAVNDRGLTI